MPWVHDFARPWRPELPVFIVFLAIALLLYFAEATRPEPRLDQQTTPVRVHGSGDGGRSAAPHGILRPTRP